MEEKKEVSMFAFKNMYNNITGFKSSCISVCYTCMILILLLSIFCFTLLAILGGAIPSFVWNVDYTFKMYCEFIGVSFKFFSIAIVAVFGATTLDTFTPKKNEDTQIEEQVQ